MEKKNQGTEYRATFLHAVLAAVGLALSLIYYSAAAQTPPTDWYVDDNAPNGNPGTIDNPFNKINDAINAASSGDIIHIAPGLYREGLTVTKTLSFLGAGAGNTILEGCMTSTCENRFGVGFYIHGGATATVHDMTIRHMLNYGISVDDDAASNTLIARGLRITDNGWHGIFVAGGSIDIKRMEISSNGQTGILINPSSGNIDIENTTISGNGFDTTSGGGITGSIGGVLNISYSTIASNKGVGFSTSTSSNNFSNTIVADNRNGNPGKDCYFNTGGAMTTLGNNIDTDNSCKFFHSDDQNATDPKLAPLAENGSPLRTHALYQGSPAIDNANAATCPLDDQRGVARPVGAGCDIGAHEGMISSPDAPMMPIKLPSGKVIVAPL